jgi:hypothetical protein
MNYYVIGIGGTGAKCVEALIHLSAGGLMPEGELYVVFVDPDKSNGNLERASITLQQYSNCKKLKLGKTDLLKTEIIADKPNVWSPFENEIRPSLANFFHYNTLKQNNKVAAQLFDVLYSPAEKETSLEKGFRGHPSIGAAVMAETVKLGEEEPWQTFYTKIKQDIKTGLGAKIFLLGSIFGGTGASGFPTIARLIRDKLETLQEGKQTPLGNIELSGALVLPYFSFIFEGQDIELKAKSEDFMINTQAGLKYYHQKSYSKIYNGIYLFGDKTQNPVSTASPGGNTQKNDPHFIELYAALSAIDLFGKENLQNCYMVARRNQNQLIWSDLPDNRSGSVIKHKIGRLTRFAFAYLSVYYPMLEDIRKNGKSYRAPWFIDFFERENISLDNSATQKSINDIKEYCETFLLWIANIHISAKSEDIQLVNYNAFAKKDDKNRAVLLQDFKLDTFSNLTIPLGSEKPNELSRLWETICNTKVRDSNAVGIGRFIHALYRECALEEKITKLHEQYQ